MKGHIFNLLEKFIIEVSTATDYEEILDKCDFTTQEPFTRLATYPDSDLLLLVQEATSHLGISEKEAFLSFGKWIFPHLIEVTPPAVTNYKHPKDLLLALDRIHQVELKKVMPDAEPPRFFCTDTGENTLDMIYSSRRQMFDLVDGVLSSLEEYFSIKIHFTKEFDDSGDFTTCLYHLKFS